MDIILGRFNSEHNHGEIQAAVNQASSVTQWVCHDNHRETFTSWAVTTKESKMRGSDHSAELRIGHG